MPRSGKASTRALRIDFERQQEPLGPAPHAAQQVRKWLIAWADRNGYDIHSDGLVVRTTLDSRLQAYANEAVERQGEALQAVADVEWSRAAVSGFGTDQDVARSREAGFACHLTKPVDFRCLEEAIERVAC